MTTPQGMKTRIDRNTHDIDELYEKLDKTDATVTSIAEVQLQHGQRLDRIDGRLDGVDGRLDRIEGTQHVHGEKLDEILGLLRQDE